LLREPDSHIGASGLIYGFVCFLFFSVSFAGTDGCLLSLYLLLFYGSMVWGILPLIKLFHGSRICCFGCRIALCNLFPQGGPQASVHVWEEDDEVETGEEYWKEDQPANSPQSEVTDFQQNSPQPEVRIK